LRGAVNDGVAEAVFHGKFPKGELLRKGADCQGEQQRHYADGNA